MELNWKTEEIGMKKRVLNLTGNASLWMEFNKNCKLIKTGSSGNSSLLCGVLEEGGNNNIN